MGGGGEGAKRQVGEGETGDSVYEYEWCASGGWVALNMEEGVHGERRRTKAVVMLVSWKGAIPRAEVSEFSMIWPGYFHVSA